MTPTRSSPPSRSNPRTVNIAALLSRVACCVCLTWSLSACIESKLAVPEARDGSADASIPRDAHVGLDARVGLDAQLFLDATVPSDAAHVDAHVGLDAASMVDAQSGLDAEMTADDGGVLGSDAGLLDPLVIGKASSFGDEIDLDTWMVYAQPFRMPFDALLDTFGMTCATTTGLARAHLAIYTDDGSTVGAPAVLINRGREVTSLVTGENAAAPVNGSMLKRALTAGTRYWLVAYLHEYPGAAVRAYRESEADPAGNYRSGALSYGDPAPTLVDTPTVIEAGSISLWIRVSL